MKTKKLLYGIARMVLAVTFLYSQADTGRAGDVLTLQGIEPAAYKQYYNSLPSVEDADAALQGHPSFSSFLDEAYSLVNKYSDLAEYAGLRLIHHHFLVRDSQIMAEDYQSINGQPSLVTTAWEINGAANAGMLPASWIFSEQKRKPMVFEASNDKAVHQGNKLIQENPEFLVKMEELLREYKLNNLISLAILKREALIPEDKATLYLEKSGKDKSVVTILGATDFIENTIRTSWSFFKGPYQHYCYATTICQSDSKGIHKLVPGTHVPDVPPSFSNVG